jgi:rRNA small subunit pseudouridine methyltransferase Nep1
LILGSRELWLIPSALSADAPTIRLSKFLPTLPETHSVAVFVGAMARG